MKEVLEIGRRKMEMINKYDVRDDPDWIDINFSETGESGGAPSLSLL